MIKKAISVFLIVIMILSISTFPERISYAVSELDPLEDTAYIDAWSDSNGEWIWSKDYDGTDVYPVPKYDGGGSITYTFRRTVPSRYVGHIKDIKSIEYNHSSSFYESAVKPEYVDIEQDYKYKNKCVIFTVKVKYLESNKLQGKGENRKKNWQAPLVQGRRFHIPVKITFEYTNDAKYDTVTAKYQDEDGNEIKSPKYYAPNNMGNFKVEAPYISGYEQYHPSSGEYDVWIGSSGENHEVIFKYKSNGDSGGDKPPPPKPMPYGEAEIRVAEEGSNDYDTSFETPIGQSTIALDLVNLSSDNVGSYGYVISDGKGGTWTTHDVDERVTVNYPKGSYKASIIFTTSSGGLFFDDVSFTVGEGPSMNMPEIEVETSPKEVLKGQEVDIDVSKHDGGSGTYKITGYSSWKILGYGEGSGKLPSSIDTSKLSGGSYRVIQTAEVENGGYINAEDYFKVIELEPPKIMLFAEHDRVQRGEEQNFLQLNTIDEDDTFPVIDEWWEIQDYNTKEVIAEGNGFIPEYYLVTEEEGTYEAFQYLEYEDRGMRRTETIHDSDVYEVFEHVGFRPIPSKQEAGKNINFYKEFNTVGDEEVEWYIREKGYGSFKRLDLFADEPNSNGAYTIDKDSINEKKEYEVKLVLEKEDGTEKEAIETITFFNNPDVTFSLDPNETFTNDKVKLVDLSKNVKLENIINEKSISLPLDGDFNMKDYDLWYTLTVDSDSNFEIEKSGKYQIKRSTENYDVYKKTGFTIIEDVETRFPENINRADIFNSIIGNEDINFKILPQSVLKKFKILPKSALWEGKSYYDYIDGSKVVKRDYSIWYVEKNPVEHIEELKVLKDVPKSTFDIKVATGYKTGNEPKMELYGGTNRGKMYKKIILDGTPSIALTDPELQEEYPIDFNSDLTRFTIEPLTSRYGAVDSSKLEDIKGEGREVIGNTVVFKGKKIQNIRIDKDGWYRIKYQVYNGREISEFDERKFKNIRYVEVKREVPPKASISIPYKTVYRNLSNSLKSQIILDVEYSSIDDNIDENSLRLDFAYDSNDDGNFENDGANSNQYFYLEKGSKNLQSYIKNISVKDLSETKKRVTITLDNPSKNQLGQFKFEFEAKEKLLIPNFIALGDVSILKATTKYIPSKDKIAEIENRNPKIEMEGLTPEGTTEIWIVEVDGTEFTDSQIRELINSLKKEKISPVIKVVRKDGTIQGYITDKNGALKELK